MKQINIWPVNVKYIFNNEFVVFESDWDGKVWSWIRSSKFEVLDQEKSFSTGLPSRDIQMIMNSRNQSIFLLLEISLLCCLFYQYDMWACRRRKSWNSFSDFLKCSFLSFKSRSWLSRMIKSRILMKSWRNTLSCLWFFDWYSWNFYLIYFSFLDYSEKISTRSINLTVYESFSIKINNNFWSIVFRKSIQKDDDKMLLCLMIWFESLTRFVVVVLQVPNSSLWLVSRSCTDDLDISFVE